MNSLAHYLMSAHAVRHRCALILGAADRDDTRHFRLVPGRLDLVVDRVVDVTRQRYPSLQVPYHARWRHFAVGGINRQELVAPQSDRHEMARAMIDLVVVSVLLDAGAGPTWAFTEAGQRFTRSEGLAVASLRAVEAGLFSSDSGNPWRVDAKVLSNLTATDLATAFQCSNGNVLVGLDGRVELLRRLGTLAANSHELFGTDGRIGNLYDYFRRSGDSIEAADILAVLLRALNPIWQGPGRLTLAGVALGDCGRHSLIPGDGFVPFHKLPQWLTYSMLEPLEQAGMTVTRLDGLTALAEYRNGGLFLDLGILEPLRSEMWEESLDPHSEAVVEWRALTVGLVDRMAPLVRERLGKTEEEFPLAKVLEGGTWAAGRQLAYERRPNGSPPLSVISDGTWF